MSRGLIYQVTNKVDGKIYIGKTSRTLAVRKREHLCDSKISNRHFQNALRKYGIDGFEWAVVEVLQVDQNIDDREKYWIQFYKSFDPAFGYNLTLGGDGGPRTEEFKQKLSKLMIGKKRNPRPEEVKRKISETQKGRVVLETTKKNMSLARKGKKFGPHTEEHKRKIAETNKGKPGTWKGKHHTPEQIEKIRVARKKYWEEKKNAR